MNFLGIWISLLFAAGQWAGIHANENANTVLNYINSKRRLHGCPPLILSEDLSLNCTQHAEDLSLMGKISHSKSIDYSYSENICTFGDNADALRLCVEKWYNGSRYDMMDAQAEEFTAMIWRSSQFMGYGEATFGQVAVMVVRFVPGGNELGQYKYNVPPVLAKFDMDQRSKEGKDKKDKKKKKKKKKNRAIHQANQAPLCMFTILTLSYWLGSFLN